jgi:hypothetical protein
MAIITIEYDARNKMARKTIEYVLSLGLFKVKHKSGIDQALEDVKNSHIKKAESVSDMFDRILE